VIRIGENIIGVDNNSVLKVSTAGAALTESIQFIQYISYTADNRPEYIGEAPPGATVSQDTWRIKRISYVGNYTASVLWASSSAEFDKNWAGRMGYNYG